MPIFQILLILLLTVAMDWFLLRLWHRRKVSGKSLQIPKINKNIFFLVSSLVVLSTTQVVMHTDEPVIENKRFSVFLREMNDHIRVDLSNPENLVIAVFLLIAGAVLFLLAYQSALPGSEKNPFNPEMKEKMGRPSRLTKQTLTVMVAGLIISSILMVRMIQLQSNLIDPILWVLVLALTGFVIASSEKQNRGFLPAWNISSNDVVIILLLVAGGLLVSSFRLTSHPAMLMGDEGNFFDTARSIAIGQYLPSFFDMGVYSYPVASSYWQGLVMNFFGVSLWSWRFSSVLIGILAVIPLYFLGLELFGRRIAVLASLFFLSAPYFLAFARLGYNNSQVLLPVTLSAWMLYRGWKNQSPLNIYLGGLAAGLGFLTYTAARIAFVSGLVILAACIIGSFLLRVQRANLKIYILLSFVFILGLFVAAGPHLIYSSQTDPQTFRYKTLESVFFNVDAASIFFQPEEIFAQFPVCHVEPYHLYFNPGVYAWLFQRGFLRTILSFFLPGLISDHFVVSPLPGSFSSLFLLIGLFVAFSKFREKRFILLISWFFLVAILLSAMNTFPPRQTHMVPIIPVMAILMAVGVDALVKTFAHLINPRFRDMTTRILLLIAGLLVISTGLYQYYSVIPRIFKPDLDQVMNWAQMSNNQNLPFVYITNRENWKNWKPFALDRFTPYRSFWVITEDELFDSRYTLPRFTDVVLIFHANEFQQVAEIIRRDFQLSAPPLHITNNSGTLIGGMSVKGNFIWPEEISLIDDLTILITSPAGIISVILLISAFLLSHPKDILKRFLKNNQG